MSMNAITHIETDFGSVRISGELRERLDAIRFETRKQDRRKRGVRNNQIRARMKLDAFEDAVTNLMRICQDHDICNSINMQ